MNKEVIYQIYPKSFNDSNSDGLGDLPGIIQKLDYMDLLGVDTLCLFPVFPTQQVRAKYAISDFYNIDPIFGNMSDFDALLEQANDRDISILLDLNFYETATDCPWFQKALSNDAHFKNFYFFSTNKKTQDYKNVNELYYKQGRFPNTAQWNLGNPIVQEQAIDILNFWSKKGVRGFVFDDASTFQQDGFREILQRIDSKEIRMMIKSDIPLLNIETMDSAPYSRNISFSDFKQTFITRISKMQQTETPATWCFTHPAMSRAISIYGDNTTKSGKMLATLIHTLPGTPIIYQGEELGMTNANYTDIEDYADSFVQEQYRTLLQKMSPDQALSYIQNTSYLNSRTPMQWNDSIFAGFSDVRPWLKTNKAYRRRNAERMTRKQDSIFYYYKSLIELRKTKACLSQGTFQPLTAPDEIFAFERILDEQRILVVLNLSDKEVPYQLPKQYEDKTILLSNCSYKKYLEPFDALMIENR